MFVPDSSNHLSSDPLDYPFSEPPEYGKTLEVVPGVHWLRMPLPMSLNHINLYLLEEADGWTIVDTGLRGEETRNYWQQIFDTVLGSKPVTRIICTHMHPDHTGQAGFLADRWRAPLHMSHAEYYQARVMQSIMRDGNNWQMDQYLQRAGVSPDFLTQMAELRSQFTPGTEELPLPGAYIRLTDGDVITIGEHQWQIITGTGHSPEHVCLYCRHCFHHEGSKTHLKGGGLLISGDQILPAITSNVSVMPTEPLGNPLPGWLASHEKFKAALPDDVLVLPAHNTPFYGVQARLQQLIDHHEERMLILEENCIKPRRAVDLLPCLFARKLDGPAMFMGLGECIAHLHCLIERNRIERTLVQETYYYRSIDPGLAQRARPGKHEPQDDSPQMV